MATDKATPPTADTNDLAAEVAELRNVVANLIEDRESLQADNVELDSRIAKLEAIPTSGSGGATTAEIRGVVVGLGAAIDRELGKVTRTLGWLRDTSFPRMPLDAPEPVVPADPEPREPDGRDGGAGASVGERPVSG